MIKAALSVRAFTVRRMRYETRRSCDDVMIALRAVVGDATHGELPESVRQFPTKEQFLLRMQEHDTTLKEAALSLGFVSDADLDRLVDAAWRLA